VAVFPSSGSGTYGVPLPRSPSPPAAATMPLDACFACSSCTREEELFTPRYPPRSLALVLPGQPPQLSDVPVHRPPMWGPREKKLVVYPSKTYPLAFSPRPRSLRGLLFPVRFFLSLVLVRSLLANCSRFLVSGPLLRLRVLSFFHRLSPGCRIASTQVGLVSVFLTSPFHMTRMARPMLLYFGSPNIIPLLTAASPSLAFYAVRVLTPAPHTTGKHSL